MIDYHAVICRSPAEFNETEVFAALLDMDAAYFNESDSLVSDEEYDTLRSYAKISFPDNHYFLGVGSEIRGEKVKLPIPMGGLSQVQIGEIGAWIKKNDLTNHLAIVSDKLDGFSAMLIYDANRKLQIAYSRGNGLEGADITRHVRKIPNVPKTLEGFSKGNFAVRGEIVIAKSDFAAARETCPRGVDEFYKNSRNMVSGIMNSKTAPEEIYEYLKFVAYGMPDSFLGKSDQFELLRGGFDVANPVIKKFSEMTDAALSEYLNERRINSDFDIDGIVIDVDDADKRNSMRPTRSTLEPANAIKYKVSDASNEAVVEVLGVEWNVSKHGYLKPTVLLEPVELVGVTVKRASGYNAKFVADNLIGPGAIVRVTRAGDVIPDILEILSPATNLLPSLPQVRWKWNDTRVDAVAIEETDRERQLKLKAFFNGLEIDGVQDATLEKLSSAGFKTIEDIVAMDADSWSDLIGKNGLKSYESLRTKLKSVYLWELMGSWPYFGRGFGKRKAKVIVDAFGTSARDVAIEDLVNLKGFDEKTAESFLKGKDSFNEFYDWLIETDRLVLKFDSAQIVIDSSIRGKKFAFTGFRDAESENRIESLGGAVQDGVKKDTDYLVAKDPSKGSNKLKKAAESGTKIISKSELDEMLAA